MSYREETRRLFENQKNDWELFRSNLSGLGNTKVKVIGFDRFNFNIQFNQKRIISSSAKVDVKSISERKCFLCKENRPDEQSQVIWHNKYEILVNPFPIFDRHFTISSLKHEDQSIEYRIGDMLDISNDLDDLLIFFNSARCGASAPDHLHFQAGNLGLLPLEDSWKEIKNNFSYKLKSRSDINIFSVDDSLRRFIVLESKDKKVIENKFNLLHKYLKEKENGDSPMLNILSYYNDGVWQLFIFLRKKHRPWQYYADGEEKILFSPASVDMGGTLITPREEDFLKITKKDVIDIFSQLFITKEELTKLEEYLEQE